jgi:hypothetical protein
MAGRVAYYGGIVKDGLIFDLDAAKKDSYPGTGTIWRDLSGNNNNGTLTNSPTFNSDNGGSFVFDGTNDYCGFPIYNYGQGNYTWSFWLKCSSQLGAVFSQGSWISAPTNSAGASNINIRNDGGLTNQIQAYFGNQPGTIYKQIQTSVNAYTNNTWFNLSVTWNFTTKTPEIYVNGSTVSTTILTLGTITTLTPSSVGGRLLTLGTYDNTRVGAFQYSGNIAQTLIYNKALTSQEVLQNYNATKGRFGL